jgi:ABC-type transporter Mla subunit MlaD
VFYVALFVSLGVVSVVVLGLLALRLWRQVRQFGREVSAAGDRIARASEELQRAAPPSSGR